MFLRSCSLTVLLLAPSFAITEIGMSYTALGDNTWQVYYKVRNLGPVGNIKE